MYMEGHSQLNTQFQYGFGHIVCSIRGPVPVSFLSLTLLICERVSITVRMEYTTNYLYKVFKTQNSLKLH